VTGVTSNPVTVLAGYDIGVRLGAQWVVPMVVAVLVASAHGHGQHSRQLTGTDGVVADVARSRKLD
jgi:hypothetical protein